MRGLHGVREPDYLLQCRRNVKRVAASISRKRAATSTSTPLHITNSQPSIKRQKMTNQNDVIAACAIAFTKAREEIMNLAERLNVSDAVANIAMHNFERLSDIAKTTALGRVSQDDPQVRITPKYLRDQLTQAGCLYLACKQAAQTRSMAEIVSTCTLAAGQKTTVKITKKLLGKRVLHLTSVFGGADIKSTLATVMSYVEQYAYRLGREESMVQLGRDVAAEAEKRGLLNGANPLSIAAGILYLVWTENNTCCEIPLSEARTARVSALSETIQERLAASMHICKKTIEKMADKIRIALNGKRSSSISQFD